MRGTNVPPRSLRSRRNENVQVDGHRICVNHCGVTIPGAAVLTLLSDEDILASPRNAHEYRAVTALLQIESC